MKKVIAILSVFAFVAAAGSAQAMSSAAGSSSSGGSSNGSRSSSSSADATGGSNDGAKVPSAEIAPIVPGADINTPCTVNCTARDPKPTPAPTPAPCPPAKTVASDSDSATKPCPKPTPAPTPAPCKVNCTPRPVASNPSSNGSHTGTQIRAVNGIVVATVPAPLPYGDGTLLRDMQTKRIYIVTNASVRPIRTLAQLAIFNGRARADVMPSVIAAYHLDMGNYSYFKNGTLVRDASNHKIYVADKGRLRAVRSLTELKTNFKGKAIKNLDPKVIANY